MKLLAITVMSMAGLLNAVPSIACDDHVGKCEIEDWRWTESPGGLMNIEGVATCNKGEIAIRIYEKEDEDERFLGITDTYIEGHIFNATAFDIEPSDPDAIMIRYAIQPM